MKLHGCCLLALFIAGPSSAQDDIPLPVPSVEKTTAYVLRPALGEVAHAEVGESLYSEFARTVVKELSGTVSESVVVSMENYRLDVPAKSVRPILVRKGGQSPMICFPVKRTGFGKMFGSHGYSGCLVDTQGNMTFDTAAFAHRSGGFPLDKPVPYTVQAYETSSVEADKFQIDVLYQGASKGEVKISYRESLNGIARPAFTQDVAYELAPDGTAEIGFKGMRIKVIKATGQSIEYVIEKTIPSFTKIRAEADEWQNKKGAKAWYQ